jgi:hypothetical protein
MGSYKPPFTKRLRRSSAEVERMAAVIKSRKAAAEKLANPYYDAEAEELIRARTVDGQYVGDDPSTPELNEAWEGGSAPTDDTAPDMTFLKADLKTAAEDMGIEVDPKWTKKAILDAIEAAS